MHLKIGRECTCSGRVAFLINRSDSQQNVYSLSGPWLHRYGLIKEVCMYVCMYVLGSLTFSAC
jgi:hypothetical protein